MFWQDLYYRLHISEIQYFLLHGRPPVLYQIMAINSIFMMLFIVRRARKKEGPNRHISMSLQWILVFTNLGVLFQSNILPYLPGLQRLYSAFT
jgi:hypothetical protein